MTSPVFVPKLDRDISGGADVASRFANYLLDLDISSGDDIAGFFVQT